LDKETLDDGAVKGAISATKRKEKIKWENRYTVFKHPSMVTSVYAEDPVSNCVEWNNRLPNIISFPSLTP
jgi:hypothetical protein